MKQEADKKRLSRSIKWSIELLKKFKIHMQKLYITSAFQTNAFAIGSDPYNASLALTQDVLHYKNRFVSLNFDYE
jgi:hypothetical protein